MPKMQFQISKIYSNNKICFVKW